MSKSVEQCIRLILENIERRKTVNFSDKNSVRRYNAAKDRIIENLEYIDTFFPEHFSKLDLLLDYTDNDVVRECVPTIFRLKHASLAQKQKIVTLSKAWLEDPHIDIISKWHIADNIAKWEAALTLASESSNDSLQK